MHDDARGLLVVAALVGVGVFASMRMQPAPVPQAPVAVTAPAPKAIRSLEHRKVHRIAPKSARPKWKAIPGVRPIPPIAKEEKRGRVKAKTRVVTARLPSCAHVKREYDRMTTAQRWAAYMAATSEQVAHGRRCLGF